MREQNLFNNVNEYARSLNETKDEKTMREFLVTDYCPVKEANAFYVEPSYADVLKRLQDLVRSCTMLAEGSFYIHSRICPVCGSNLVAPDGTDYICALCESTYHIFGFGSKMYLWLKILPNVATAPKAKKQVVEHSPFRINLRVERPETDEEEDDDFMPVEEAAPETTAEETPVEETAIDELAPIIIVQEEEEDETPIAPEAEEDSPVEEVSEAVVEETPMEEPVEEAVIVEEEAVNAPVEETPMETPAQAPVEEKQRMRMRVRLRVHQKKEAPKTEAVEKAPAETKEDEIYVDVVN